MSGGVPGVATGGAEGADTGENHVGFSGQVKRSPFMPSAEVRDTHAAQGHAVYRNWCADCVQGRGRNGMHQSRDHTVDDTPVISWDYVFLSSQSPDQDVEAEASGQSPVICMRDRASQACGWTLVPKKGTDFSIFGSLVASLVEDLNALGYKRVCFRCDNDRALMAVLRSVKDQLPGEVVSELTRGP